MKWFRYEGSIVNYEEGKVLQPSDANDSVILAPFDASRQNQKWTIFPLENEEFVIINNDGHKRLTQLEDSFGISFVKIGTLPQSGYEKERWYFKIVE